METIFYNEYRTHKILETFMSAIPRAGDLVTIENQRYKVLFTDFYPSNPMGTFVEITLRPV